MTQEFGIADAIVEMRIAMNSEETVVAKPGDAEIDKIKKRLRWLRWKGDVLMREVRLIERLKKAGAKRP